MRSKSSWATVVLAMGILSAGSGCETDTPSKWKAFDARLDSLNQEMKSLSSEIKSLAVTSPCDNDSECKVMGIGTRACKGYEAFVIYSVQGTNESELRAKIQRLNYVSEEYNKNSYKVPDCGKTPPRPRCVNKQCISVK